ncbi:MAG: hypothetical protein IPK86_02520 [Neisseriales bacterium]|nr:MAG: hypothetical protein IPK86_02520 [Neisseriales bacterium]
MVSTSLASLAVKPAEMTLPAGVRRRDQKKTGQTVNKPSRAKLKQVHTT